MPFDVATHHYCFAIVRKDLKMPCGKLSAQAGHAYAAVLRCASQKHSDRIGKYENPATGGSKITLEARNTNQLLKAYNLALGANLPAVVIVDHGHILLPHFTGEPVITAVGIGPCLQSEVAHFTRKLNCVK